MLLKTAKNGVDICLITLMMIFFDFSSLFPYTPVSQFTKFFCYKFTMSFEPFSTMF